jgi:hypothetical protein
MDPGGFAIPAIPRADVEPLTRGRNARAICRTWSTATVSGRSTGASSASSDACAAAGPGGAGGDQYGTGRGVPARFADAPIVREKGTGKYCAGGFRAHARTAASHCD